ncbi:hypothetical protein RPALISO_141 [Ruegeria phage RpAliso]|nr:hypothetical protein RPALISO_141 [Ruegeria phage RpAliso]
MKNLATVRRLRGQTSRSMRAAKRRADDRIADLYDHLQDANAENAMLRDRLRKSEKRLRLEIPKSLIDDVLREFAHILGRSLAEKFRSENEPMLICAARLIAQEIAAGYHYFIDPRFNESDIMVREILNQGDPSIEFSMQIDRLVLNNRIPESRVAPYAMYDRMEKISDVIKEPTPITVRNSDLLIA